MSASAAAAMRAPISKRLFSTDSTKAIKAQGYGYLNAIHYLAPASLSGANLCPHASPGCIALCLGWFSGQAGMVSDQERDTNSVRLSRVTKAQQFMHQRKAYVAALVRQIRRHEAEATRLGMRLCVRLNGSSDIAWEGIRTDDGRSLFDLFPHIDFVDYTKNAKRFDRVLPGNYHLTLSRSETNEAACLAALARGVNVAVVFAGTKPATWHGFDVIDGDLHDLRQLDPRGTRGVVIALSPKGAKARRDQSGFVIRYEATI
jgi:hypothetical protein